MTFTGLVVNSALRGITRIICRVNDRDLARVPARGPLILVSNHINFLEVPLIYTHLLPRPITGLAKAETWEDPLLRPLFNLWQAIPIHRGEPDLHALRLACHVLSQGGIVAVAPEGTRSGHGRLGRAQPGIVVLAQMSRAPLLPLAYYGGEKFSYNIRRLRRTDFNIAVGRPFRLAPAAARLTRQERQQAADEIMGQVAALLPPAYRGVYSQLPAGGPRFLEFDPPAAA